MYQQAHEEETGEVIQDRWINRYGKDDAEFESWHAEGRDAFEDDLAAFLNALALVRSIRTIKGRIDGIKDVKNEAKKKLAKDAQDLLYLTCCPVAQEYKGVRKKKGCNGTDQMCISCTQKFTEVQSAKNSGPISQSAKEPTESA